MSLMTGPFLSCSQADVAAAGGRVQGDVPRGRRPQHDLLPRGHLPRRQPHMVLQRRQGQEGRGPFKNDVCTEGEGVGSREDVAK